MPTRIQDVQFPLGGLNRALAFSKQQQAPYTTYDANNVRPRDKEFDRLTGGSRPGLSRYATTTGQSQLLKAVKVKKDGGFSIWEDAFQYTAGSGLVIPNMANSTVPTPVEGVLSSPTGSTTTNTSFMLPVIPAFDPTTTFRFGVHIVPAGGDTTWPINLRLYFGMSGSGDSDNCYYLEFTGNSLTAGYAPRFRRIESGSITFSSTSIIPLSIGGVYPGEGFIEIEINGTTASCYWRGAQVDMQSGSPVSVTLPAAITSAQTRLGVRLQAATSNSVATRIDRAYVQYNTTSPRDSARSRLISCISGVMQYETYRGNMVASTSPMQLAPSGYISAAESGQKLYIADNPTPVAQGKDGAFTSSGTVFDSASYTDWTTVLTNARRGDYYLQIDPIPRSTSAIANTYTFAANELDGDSITMGYYGTNPGVQLTCNNGTLSLSTVSGLTFSVGDGTADATMLFKSNAATPALRRAAIVAALTNCVFTATNANTTQVDITQRISGNQSGNVRERRVVKNMESSDEADLRELPGFVTNYTIEAVASGSLTIVGGPSANTSGLSWRILRCPKVYDPLADEEAVIASGTDGVITSTSIFDSPSYSAWGTTMAGKEYGKYALQILSGSTITAEYPIVGLNTSNIGGDTDHLLIGTATNATGLTWQITRRDKLLRWSARRGEVPVGGRMVERYQDRLVIAGFDRNPQNWCMSRMGDPDDFQYSDVDAGAAVMGLNSQAGVIGEPITALIPYNDDNFFFGGRSSLWLMRGNPAGGGRIDNVSYTVGVIGPTAWCHGPAGEVIWISRDGIYYTSPQCLSCEPIAFSRDKLPKEFLDINPDQVAVSMAYDVRDRGVHVYLTPLVYSSSGAVASDTSTANYSNIAMARHWFIHWESKSFWPVSFSNGRIAPVLALAFTAPSPKDSGVLVAGYYTNIYRSSRSAWADDVYVLNSYVNFGPLGMVSTPYHRGIVRTVDVIMAEAAKDTTWSIYDGDTAEAVATNSTAFQTGTFTDSAQTTIAPLMGGTYWRLKLAGTGPWAFDSASAVISQLGKDRTYA